jgi:hypothetical protein
MHRKGRLKAFSGQIIAINNSFLEKTIAFFKRVCYNADDRVLNHFKE